MKNKLKVNIDNARVERIYIRPKEEGAPEVEVYLGLFVGDKRVSSIIMDTDSWDKERQYELSLKDAELIGKLEKSIGLIATNQFQAGLKMLEVHDE